MKISSLPPPATQLTVLLGWVGVGGWPADEMLIALKTCFNADFLLLHDYHYCFADVQMLAV